MCELFGSILAAGACLYLMLQLPLVTWIRFVVWLAIGLVLYFAYGHRHSKLRQKQSSSAAP